MTTRNMRITHLRQSRSLPRVVEPLEIRKIDNPAKLMITS